MEDELRELRELVTQLKADNERLRQEQVPAAVPGPSNISIPVSDPPLIDAGPSSTERFVFVPRDRRCPKFSGRSGVDINEWVEEAEACMRLRHLSSADQAFFLFDHLEGEAREEIRYRPQSEREDPKRVIQVLRDLYGCTKSYVALQESFFSRRQQEGETLVEFSLALMSLLEKVKGQSPHGMPNAETLLRDQFVENVNDCTLRRELKQFVRRQPTATLVDARGEALRWEREGMPGGARGRSQSVPSAYGIQYGVQGNRSVSSGAKSEMTELRDMLLKQQQQLNQLAQSMTLLQNCSSKLPPHKVNPVICRRCRQPGHFARNCDGERIPVRAPSAYIDSAVTRREQSSSSQPSEN
ncbi:uncharacterized protein LOC130232232 [Danio aesculapii]|uniref:uncharacterized protein LOC130232232 n=1 Tax=Danio aesculapii TaxID=1142201 RepID=UPI0024C0D14A|nr:uncharacterized protein LOC130232232 [Danio aesculapii]